MSGNLWYLTGRFEILISIQSWKKLIAGLDCNLGLLNGPRKGNAPLLWSCLLLFMALEMASATVYSTCRCCQQYRKSHRAVLDWTFSASVSAVWLINVRLNCLLIYHARASWTLHFLPVCTTMPADPILASLESRLVIAMLVWEILHSKGSLSFLLLSNSSTLLRLHGRPIHLRMRYNLLWGLLIL